MPSRAAQRVHEGASGSPRRCAVSTRTHTLRRCGDYRALVVENAAFLRWGQGSPEASAKVFRVSEHFAVKMGHRVPLIEAENMQFLAENSKVPVLKAHTAFRDADTKKSYIIMDYISGDTLQTLLPSLSVAEKDEISTLVKEAFTEMRSIPPPDYLGILNRNAYLHGVFWSDGLDPKISGPFASQQEMNVAIIEKLRQTESAPSIRLLKNMVDQTLRNHRALFTHGDLQPKNIIVERSLGDHGCPKIKITFIGGASMRGKV
ncbi:hypothetical protein BJY01DRAFT_248377 [Aspergillus pseudoustus]|uniref:Protein kinase domain-containing protein n=1 Tax=Aspergillus pseudoustus TaxID=1810923 RepID=A0ABR4JWF0_9EURO